MELLIPGLVLVALMVYVSTRIKKTAASAFEAERIETADFSVSKPEGLLSRVEPEPPFLFEAYSKDFGQKPFENVRLITAEVKPLDHTNVAAAVDAVKRSVETVTAERPFSGGCLVEARETRDEAEMNAFYKIVKNDDRVLSLHIAALREPTGDALRKIEELLESFAAK